MVREREEHSQFWCGSRAGGGSRNYIFFFGSLRSGLRVVVTICDGAVSHWASPPTSLSLGLSPTDHSWSMEEALSVPVPPHRQMLSSELRLMFLMALVPDFFVSIVAAKHLSTWLCLHLFLPWERLILQPVRLCLCVTGSLSGKNRS